MKEKTSKVMAWDAMQDYNKEHERKKKKKKQIIVKRIHEERMQLLTINCFTELNHNNTEHLHHW